MLNMKYLKKEKAFTFVELIITIFVFTVGILGVYKIVQYPITDIRRYNSRLAAVYLGQEGIEVVKNMRDGNLVQISTGSSIPWDQGLSGGVIGSGGLCYESAYNDVNFTLKSCSAAEDCNGFSNLLLGASGFYSYSGGSLTKFKREIKIEDVLDGQDIYKKVSVIVCWQDNGKNYKAVVMDYLYNYWTP